MTATYSDQRGAEDRSIAASRAITISLWLIFFGLIFLQRFAVAGVPLSFATNYLALISLVLLRIIVLDKVAIIYFMVATSMATLSVFLTWRTETSYSSYLYLLSILILYTLRFRNSAVSFAIARRIYMNFMLVAAVAGIAQFALQFVFGYEAVFPFEKLPEGILLKGYNVIIPLTYGANIIKSNGLFFLEPSFFGQFLAIALILEMLGRQRALRCGIYATALICSYSGTGIATMMVFLPFVLIRRVNVTIVIAGVVLAVAVGLLASVLGFDTIFARTGEFTAPESSGFARFVSPFLLIRDFLTPSPAHFLFGMGPGTIDVAVANAIFHGYLAHDPTWIKLIFEYGLIGGVILGSFVVTMMYAGSRDRLLSTALLFNWLFLGGYLLSGLINVLLISLGALHAKPAREQGRQPAMTRRRRVRSV